MNLAVKVLLLHHGHLVTVMKKGGMTSFITSFLSQFCLTSYMQSPMSVLQADCKSEPRASRAEDCDSWMCSDEADPGSIKLGAHSHPLTVLLWRSRPAQEQGGKLEQHPCKLFE